MTSPTIAEGGPNQPRLCIKLICRSYMSAGQSFRSLNASHTSPMAAMINPVKRPKGARKEVFQKKDLLGTIKARGSNTEIQTQRMTAATRLRPTQRLRKIQDQNESLLRQKSHSNNITSGAPPCECSQCEIFRALLGRRIDLRQKNKCGKDSTKYQTRCRD